MNRGIKSNGTTGAFSFLSNSLLFSRSFYNEEGLSLSLSHVSSGAYKNRVIFNQELFFQPEMPKRTPTTVIDDLPESQVVSL